MGDEVQFLLGRQVAGHYRPPIGVPHPGGHPGGDECVVGEPGPCLQRHEEDVGVESLDDLIESGRQRLDPGFVPPPSPNRHRHSQPSPVRQVFDLEEGIHRVDPQRVQHECRVGMDHDPLATEVFDEGLRRVIPHRDRLHHLEEEGGFLATLVRGEGTHPDRPGRDRRCESVCRERQGRPERQVGRPGREAVGRASGQVVLDQTTTADHEQVRRADGLLDRTHRSTVDRFTPDLTPDGTGITFGIGDHRHLDPGIGPAEFGEDRFEDGVVAGIAEPVVARQDDACSHDRESNPSGGLAYPSPSMRVLSD